MTIRELDARGLEAAIGLRVRCWTEELAGRAENALTVADELREFSEWKSAEAENDDRRLLLGAYEDGALVGAAFASFAEATDVESGAIELNGLWVDGARRGEGLSLRLLRAVFDAFADAGVTKMVVYSHHYAPSNSFYRKYGPRVLRQDRQLGGRLLIDVFVCDIERFRVSA